MSNTGRFETTTRTKVRTPGGTILKTTTYPEDSEPFVEYNIRPICAICKEPIECICFNFNNCDDPYSEALEHLQKDWICPGIECRLKYLKEDHPELYEEIETICNGNKFQMANAISDTMPELEEGEFCSC